MEQIIKTHALLTALLLDYAEIISKVKGEKVEEIRHRIEERAKQIEEQQSKQA